LDAEYKNLFNGKWGCIMKLEINHWIMQGGNHMLRLRFIGKGIMATLLILSLIFFFWGPAGAKEPIKFGVSTAISGDAAAYGKPFLDAIQMMAHIFNEEGGIMGRPVKVIYYDDKGVPDAALEICKKLVYEDKVHTLQPGSTSGCIMTGMPVGKEAKVAMWGYGLAQDWLSQGEGMIWRCAAPDEVMIAALAQYAVKRLGVRTVAIMHLDTFYGETSKNVFVRWLSKLGGKVTKITTYTEGDRDFSSQFMTLASTKPDAVYLVAQGGAAAPALRQLRQFMGKEVKVLSDNNWFNPHVRKEAGDSANGIYYYVHPAVSVNPDPVVQKWLKECEKRLGTYHEIMGRALVGMAIMKEAITRAKTTAAIPVNKEIHKMKKFATAMGPFTYDPRDGEGIKTGMVVTPIAGENLTKDKVVFTYTIKDALYDHPPNYTKYFGKGYYDQLLKFHGLK
jgi:branched-chain amino acid transport system substrate-binding protein